MTPYPVLIQRGSVFVIHASKVHKQADSLHIFFLVLSLIPSILLGSAHQPPPAAALPCHSAAGQRWHYPLLLYLAIAAMAHKAHHRYQIQANSDQLNSGTHGDLTGSSMLQIQ